MAKMIKIVCAPEQKQLEDFAVALEKNGFVVSGSFLSEKEGRAVALPMLRHYRQEGHKYGAVWFVVKDEAAEFWAEADPSEEEVISATAGYRRRRPNDLLESFAVQASIVAPLYGLAGAIAEQLGMKSSWVRDCACPMLLTVTKREPLQN